jgi:hypothetical protein
VVQIEKVYNMGNESIYPTKLPVINLSIGKLLPKYINKLTNKEYIKVLLKEGARSSLMIFGFSVLIRRYS